MEVGRGVEVEGGVEGGKEEWMVEREVDGGRGSGWWGGEGGGEWRVGRVVRVPNVGSKHWGCTIVCMHQGEAGSTHVSRSG